MIFLLILNFCTYGFIMFCFNGRIFNFCFSVFSSYDFLMCLIWFDMLFTSFFLWCVSCDMFHHFPFWPVLQSTFSITCVVLATAPKQHCNVEWFPPPPRVGRIIDIQKYMFVFFVCVAVCKMLKLTCGPKNGCNTLACAGAVGVVRCSWIAGSRDGCFNFYT